jgi:hypothetical protein
MNTKTEEKKVIASAKIEEKNPVAQNGNSTNVDKNVAVIAMIEKFKPEPPKTAEERIEKSKQFEAISKRFTQLKEKSQELLMFEAGNDKLKAKIIFENQAGFKFEIQNSNVIEKLKDCAKDELSILLNEVDNEIMTFQM